MPKRTVRRNGARVALMALLATAALAPGAAAQGAGTPSSLSQVDAVTLLADGRVLTVGLTGQGAKQRASAELLDPATGASSATPRFDPDLAPGPNGSLMQQVKEAAEKVEEHHVKVTMLAERWCARDAGLTW